MANWQRRKDIMLCYPFEEKRLLKWEPPYLVQPKLDGVRCRAVPLEPDFDNSIHSTTSPHYILISSEGNVINSVPHINAALNETNWNTELDGELYIHDSSFEEIVSITSRTKNIHSDYERVEYHAFDIISTDDAQLVRSKELYEMFQWTNTDPCIKKVMSKPCFSLNGIMEVYKSIIDAGYEGMIVRNVWAPYARRRSTNIMKFKPKRDDFYRIIGTEMEYDQYGNEKNQLGALICDSGYVPGNPTQSFNVGTGFTEQERKELWEGRSSLIGKLCHVQYQHLTTGRKVPRFPVFVTIVDPQPII